MINTQLEDNKIQSKIIELKIKLELLKNQQDIKKYLELSNTFNVKSYFNLIEEYNNNSRLINEDEVKKVEQSKEVQEYLYYFKKDYVQKFNELNENLAYLEMLLNNNRKER